MAKRLKRVILLFVISISVTVLFLQTQDWNFQNTLVSNFQKNETEVSVMFQWALSQGESTYYSLPSVQTQLIKEVQEQSKEIFSALEECSVNIVKNYYTRGIVVYLPPKMDTFKKQLKSLYLSLAYMRVFQQKNMKTDLLVFASADELEYPLSLGCVEKVRKSFKDPELCTLIKHVPIKEKPLRKHGLPDPLIALATQIELISTLAEFKYASLYDYLLRTDLDTFIAPGFSDWLPSKPSTVIVGAGGYGSLYANSHLKWVTTDKLKLNDTGIRSSGSSWYGSSKLLVALAKTTETIMRYLHTQDFTEFDKCCSGTDGWPNWHWPVLALYGMHIAINQLGPENVQMSQEGIAQMDVQSSNSLNLTHSIKHIHCWHDPNRFSKFLLSEGKYADLDITEFANMTTPSDYATTIAISCERLTNEELQVYISEKYFMREKAWIRAVPKNATIN